MSGKVTLQTLTLEELLQGQVQQNWNNPDRLALLTPEKHLALAENPEATDYSLPAQIVAFSDSRVIGSIELVQAILTASGRNSPILWGSNLFVHPDYRHVAAGIALLMQMQRSFHTVGVVGVSKMVHGVYQGLKWQETAMPRFVWAFKSKQILQAILKSPALGTLGSLIGNPVLAIRKLGLGMHVESALNEYVVECVEALPTDFEILLQPRCQGVCPVRSVARINWLLQNGFDNDRTRAKSLITVRSHDRKPVGFVLTKQKFFESASQKEIKEITLATVADWGFDSESGVSELDIVLLGTFMASKMKADAVEIPTASLTLQSSLASLGFRQIGELNVFLKTSSASPLQSRRFDYPEVLRPSDGDNFFA